MDQKFISNQEVFSSVQPATLKVEPDFKSTILYSNKYASQSPVEPQGELAQILNSSIGSVGTNVLIQLKQKLTVLEGGPWYIDLTNGVIHVHNRRYTNKPVSYYCYQSENGEVLSASFRLVEQYKNMGSLKSFINDFTKGLNNFVGTLQNSIAEQQAQWNSNIDEKKAINDYYDHQRILSNHEIRDKLTHKPDNTRVDRTNVEIEASQASKPWVRKDVKRAESKYKFSTPQQRNQELAYKKKEVRDNIDIPSAMNLARKKYGDLDKALKRYEQLIGNTDVSREEVEAARNYAFEVAKGKKVYVGNTRGIYGEFYKDITVYDWAHSGGVHGASSGPPTKQALDIAVRKEVNRLLKVNGSRDWSYISYTPSSWVPVTGWLTPTKAKGHWYSAFEPGMYMKYKAVVRVKFKGYTGITVYEDLSKVMGRAVPRTTPRLSGGNIAPINASSFFNNATNNLGRQKKETRLEGTLLVVGNPHLETGQQLYLSNVGKEYSGLWYIAKAIHKLETSSGYTTECLLLRSMPKKKNEGEAEYTSQPTQESTDNSNQETRHPKPTTGNNSSNTQGTTSQKSKSSGKKQTLYLNAPEVDWIVQHVSVLNNAKEVESVATREILDIAVVRADTGKSPISTNQKGQTSKDHVQVVSSKRKLSDPAFKSKVSNSVNLKELVQRIVRKWLKSKGNK